MDVKVIIRDYLSYLILSLLKLIGLVTRRDFVTLFVQYINKNIVISKTYNDIVFDCNYIGAQGRGENFAKKEPDTLYWIDNYIEQNEVFYDIGANVGVYSLYVAKNKNCKVVAFEPEISNFYFFTKNIFLNNLNGLITPLNIGLYSEKKLSTIYQTGIDVGSSGNHLEHEVDDNLKSFSADRSLNILAFDLDYLVKNFDLPFPNHIKIDVDGMEHMIMQGTNDILKNKNLKTIAVENNTSLKEHKLMLKEIEASGFKKLENEFLRNTKYELTGTVNTFFKRKE